MSHPYTDHYPMPDMSINERLRDHERRIKELESRLGAALSGISSVGATAGSGRHDATSDHIDTQQAGESASVPTAAPSVSSRGRIRWGTEHQQDDIFRADDLAAAVTEWYESRDGSYVNIRAIACAFVRGEPLPQEGK